MTVCLVSVYCVCGAIALFLMFYLDQVLIVLEDVHISFSVFVCYGFFAFCWFSICVCLCSGFLDFCMLHCCQGIVSMGSPVFWIDYLGIHRCHGCACLLMRVLACISSYGSCKQGLVFLGNSRWYWLDTAYGISWIQHVYTACVSVYVCVCSALCWFVIHVSLCVFRYLLYFRLMLSYSLCCYGWMHGVHVRLFRGSFIEFHSSDCCLGFLAVLQRILALLYSVCMDMYSPFLSNAITSPLIVAEFL